MATLWIGNIPPNTSDQELMALLVKYGFPEFNGIEHIRGEGTRTAAALTFDAMDTVALQRLQPRVHNLYWKDRRLNVEVPIGTAWRK